jgi:vanillate O-demethylase ferredoxin subunit
MAARPIKTVSVVVSAIDEPLPGVKRFVLSDQDHWPLPPFTPGAHIDLHLGGGLVRTYRCATRLRTGTGMSSP